MEKSPRRAETRRRGAVARGIALAVLLALLASSGSALRVGGQDPGVTVVNVPPEFSAIDIGSAAGVHRIDVVVSDYNSWRDIYRVDVEVLDDARSLVAHVFFQQYTSPNATERLEGFVQGLGEILVQDLSTATYNPNPETIAERSEMRITFVITPVRGRWLKVTASDLAGLIATAQVEYLTGTIGGPSAVHPLVLLLLSVAASVVVVGARLRRERHGV